MNYGENLARYRKRAGMTQEQLAEAINVSRALIAQCERGTKSITLQVGKLIADTLGITVDDLCR